MKIHFYTIVTFLSFVSNSFSQNGYDVYLHLPPTAYVSSIAETTDGGFIGCGAIINSIDGTSDFYFCRYDDRGNFLWETQFKDTTWGFSPTDENSTDIILDYNGDFIFGGTVGDPDNFYNHTAVVGKLDSTGHINTILYICDGKSSNGGILRQYSDSSALFQYHEYYGAGHNSTPFWRFNSQLDTVWFAGIHENYGYNSLAINQDKYTFALGRSSEYQYNLDFFTQPVVKRFNSSGQLDWEFVFTREAYPVSYPIFQAIAGKTDNGMLICGTDFINGDEQIFLIDISSSGDSSGIKHYGSNRYEKAKNIILCPDSGFIITGSAENICVPGSRDLFLLKVDKNYDSLWFKTFSGLNTNEGLKIFNTNDNGFLIFGVSDTLIHIIKTNSQGIINSQNPYIIQSNQSCNVFCMGDTATLNLNLPAQTYLWSTGETTSTIKVTQSGFYSVKVSNINGEIFDVPYFQVIFLNLNITFSSDTINACNNINLQPSSGNDPGYSYQWYKNDSLLPFQTNTSLQINTTGNYQLITNSQCGIDTSIVFVKINPNPQVPNIYHDSSPALCQGDSVRLYTDNAWSYNWFDYFSHDTIPVSIDSFYYCNTTMYLYLIITDSAGCKSNRSYENVRVLPIANRNIGNDTTLCINNSIMFDASGNFNSYQWQDLSTQSTYNLYSSVPDTFLIYCKAYTRSLCYLTDTIRVIYDACLGILSEKDDENVFQFFPNPFKDEITIQSKNKLKGKLIISDEIGRIFMDEKISDDNIFNLSFLLPGIYFFKIEIDKNIFYKKLVKIE